MEVYKQSIPFRNKTDFCLTCHYITFLTSAWNPLKSDDFMSAELQEPCHQHLLLEHCAYSMKLEMWRWRATNPNKINHTCPSWFQNHLKHTRWHWENLPNKHIDSIGLDLVFKFDRTNLKSLDLEIRKYTGAMWMIMYLQRKHIHAYPHIIYTLRNCFTLAQGRPYLTKPLVLPNSASQHRMSRTIY